MILQHVEHLQHFSEVVERYFDFIIISAKNAALPKYTEQTGRNTPGNISEIVENSFLIPKQNSFNYRFLKLKLAIQVAIFKTKHSSSIHPKIANLRLT